MGIAYLREGWRVEAVGERRNCAPTNCAPTIARRRIARGARRRRCRRAGCHPGTRRRRSAARSRPPRATAPASAGARRVVRARVEHDGGAERQRLEVGAEAAEVERARRGVVVAVRRHLEPRRAEDVVVDRPRRRDVHRRARRLGADDARGEREAAGARERLRRAHAVGVRVAEDEPRRRLVRRAEPVDRQVLLVVARREQRRRPRARTRGRAACPPRCGRRRRRRRASTGAGRRCSGRAARGSGPPPRPAEEGGGHLAGHARLRRRHLEMRRFRSHW